MDKPTKDAKLTREKAIDAIAQAIESLSSPTDLESVISLALAELKNYPNWHLPQMLRMDIKEARPKQVGGNHYDGAVDVHDLINAQGLDFYQGQAVKYVTRYKRKGGLQDLEKAKWYIEYMISRENNGTAR